MGILENELFEDTEIGHKSIPSSRLLNSEDKQRINAISLSFKVGVLIPTENPEGNHYGTEIHDYLKSKGFDLELDGYQIGITPQNQRFDIIPQGENLTHVYVPIQE